MAAVTSYNLSYDQPCDAESGCGSAECGGKPEFNSRPQIFCEDVTILMDCTIQGNLSVVPAQITVGGQTFTPTVIETISGPHLVLAVY
jgi:hypothetical protein